MRDVSLDDLDEVVFRTDSGGLFVYLNRPWTSITGFALSESVGRPLLDFLHPDDRDRAASELRSLEANEGQRAVYRARHLHRTGDAFWVEVHARRADPSRPTYAGSVGSIRAAPAAVLESPGGRGVDSLAVGIAHQINNPLACVISNLQFALETVIWSGTTPDVPDALKDAMEGAERIRRIVAELQGLAPGAAPAQPVDLVAVIERALALAEPVLRPRVQVVNELQPVPPVRGDRVNLSRAFYQLLLNAAQAIPAGRERGTVRIGSRATPAGVVVEVADDGSGIAPQDLPRIFDPFFTTKGRDRGFGLGLTQVRSAVESASGRIEVESQPGAGTIFRVTLLEASG